MCWRFTEKEKIYSIFRIFFGPLRLCVRKYGNCVFEIEFGYQHTQYLRSVKF